MARRIDTMVSTTILKDGDSNTNGVTINVGAATWEGTTPVLSLGVSTWEGATPISSFRVLNGAVTGWHDHTNKN